MSRSAARGARPSLPFDCFRYTIDNLRAGFKNSIKLELHLELKHELCHLTDRFSLQWSTTLSLRFPPISPPQARLKSGTLFVNLGRQPITDPNFRNTEIYPSPYLF